MIRWITLAALPFSLPAISVADEEKAPVPPGYEDALAADKEAADAAAEEGGALAKAKEKEEEEDGKRAKEEKVDANVLRLERQYLRHFQRILDAERSFIPRVCDITNEQRRELAKTTDGVPKTAARKYALWQNKMRRGGIRAVQGRNPTAPDPRTLILDELLRAVRKCLGPVQAQRYNVELAKRADHRKRTAILNLVAKLDDDLVLTAQQRAKLTQSLTANWQDAWAQSLQLFRNNNRFLPRIPDRHIVPILNPTQKAVWRGAQKQNVQFWGGMGFGNAFVIVNDFVVDAEVENDGGKKK